MSSESPRFLRSILGAPNLSSQARRRPITGANERYQEITLKYIDVGKRTKENTFIGIAKVNAPHFTPTNRDAWKDLHKQALRTARAAGKDATKLDVALVIAPPNPELMLYYAIIGSNMSKVILKNIQHASSSRCAFGDRRSRSDRPDDRPSPRVHGVFSGLRRMDALRGFGHGPD